MSSVRLAAAVGCLLLALPTARVEPAYACSCAQIDPRSALAAADGAFVGTFVERRAKSGGRADYAFRVERALKGRIGTTVVVESSDSGAACGLEVEVGQRIGLVLQRERGRWTSNLCWQMAPGTLLQAARPLPRPNGSGPVALLVGGRLGNARTIALDARGRTLGYGRGRGETILLATCPGTRRVVEYAAARPDFLLAVRDLRTYRLIRERRYRPRGSASVAALACLDRSGAKLAIFETSLATQPVARLVVGGRTAWSGKALGAAFGRGVAYVSSGSTILRIELATGNVTRRTPVPLLTGALAVSPAGAVAGIAPSRLVRVDPAGRVRAVPASIVGAAEIAWWSGRIVVLPRWSTGSAQVFDEGLRLVGRVGSWTASDSAVANGRAFGVWEGALLAADLPRGPAKVLRRLPGPVTHLLVPA